VYQSLQYLRALAVISVLILHSHSLFTTPVFKLPLFSNFGWLGVRLFFVISGFIVADRISHCVDLRDYLIRRYFRVFPLYFLVTLAALVIASVFGKSPFLLVKTDTGMPFDPQWTAYLIKSFLILPQDDWPLFAVGWSLEFELVFYAFFGLAYFMAGALTARLVLFSLALVGATGLMPGSQVAHVFLLYFFAGCICRDAYRYWRRGSFIASLTAFPSATALWVLDLYGHIDFGLFGFVVASAVSFASLVVLFLSLEPYLHRMPMHAKIVLIGDASFSIYLIHWVIFGSLSGMLIGVNFAPGVAEAMRLLVVVGSVVASILVYRHIEIPVNERVISGVRVFRSSGSGHRQSDAVQNTQ